MRVLITSDFYSPTINGVVTSIVNLREGLKKLGHEVRVLTLRQKNHIQEKDVWYLPSVGLDAFVAPSVRLRTWFPQDIYEEILAWKPDIVHSQCEFCSFGPAKRIARKLNIPIVNTYHTVYEDYVRYLIPVGDQFGRFAARQFTYNRLERVDAVIAPTGKTEKLLKSYGVDTDIYVIPSGLDLSAFRGENHGEMYTEIKNRAEGKRCMMFLGRLAKEKNVDELIDYYRRLNDPDLLFFIVGDGPVRKSLEALAQDLKGRVIFLGMISPDKIPDCYAAADVFVSASTSETQGLTYFEALASGTPVICRDDECVHDVIQDGRNGYLFRNFEEFSHALRKLRLQNHESVRNECHKSADRFSRETFASDVEKMYIDVLDKNRMSSIGMRSVWGK